MVENQMQSTKSFKYFTLKNIAVVLTFYSSYGISVTLWGFKGFPGGATWDFPGSSVVKILPSYAEGMDSIPS